MLTNVQKETLQTLINLYQSSNGRSIRGEEIAESIHRNPGTIRNQMISLRSLGLVKGVPGPGGGYKPTIEAYHSLNISVSANDSIVPIYKNGKKLDGVSVARIEFTSVPQPTECEAAIKVLGTIKDLNLGDVVRIGPTPVNNLGVIGTVVGRDDMDNIILLDATTIRSIPKTTVGDISSDDLILFRRECSIKDAARKLASNEIDGAPVVEDGKVVGIFTVNDLVNALKEPTKHKVVGDVMSPNVVFVNEDLKIANAIDLMLKESVSRMVIMDNNHNLCGIVTRTDLINCIVNLDQFPIFNNQI